VQATLGAGTRFPLKGTDMIGDLFDSPWKILIVAVVLIVLFGSKKLPDAARSLGKSMRILKAEVQDLHGDHDAQGGTLPDPHQQQIEQLQQQIRDLQQAPANGAATVNGAPLTETQRTQQPG
jgi:sec-independent protein translocase protein TatA